jgi:ABC-type bacteriocin/lantibiotic exporter with double-glycine peptidase domain
MLISLSDDISYLLVSVMSLVVMRAYSSFLIVPFIALLINFLIIFPVYRHISDLKRLDYAINVYHLSK